jgi:NADH-quinone oxidoreductase subunit F
MWFIAVYYGQQKSRGQDDTQKGNGIIGEKRDWPNMSFEEIRHKAQQQWQNLQNSQQPVIFIGTATCGRSAGALEVLEVFQKEISQRGIEAHIVEVGCIGLCSAEPLVCISKPGKPGICYGNITPKRGLELIENYLVKDDCCADYALGVLEGEGLDGIVPLFETSFFRDQVRRTLGRCGMIDPCNINHYISHNGYSGLINALEIGSEKVIEQVKMSGLRGRGGAGFPTWHKWQLCKEAKASEKYMVCNADEGDPGAFMNRSLLEGDPHALLEGMLIAGYAIGASLGYIYCRAEYPLALERLRTAIGQAQDYGLLGENILGSGFDFQVKLKEGAGAFVCGEETALIASIEGDRGMPRPRPPFPANSGLWQKPTIINNVETLAAVALVLQNGAEWFAQYGTEQSKGTKTFALVGQVKNTGLVEVPLGITLKEMIFDIGGGVLGNKQFKAVQTGGPSGGCIPYELLNTPVDYDSLKAAGTIMGSGGMVVMDENTCMVDFARYFLDFAQKESCGKCVPCRLGTKQLLDILEDITTGKGREGDIALLVEIGEAIKAGSICGLGQTAPNPVLTTIRYFRDEYDAHVKYKQCPAGVCRELTRFEIEKEVCTGCGLCRKACPLEAILGERKKAHEIIQERCTRCGVCREVCPFGAVIVACKKDERP